MLDKLLGVGFMVHPRTETLQIDQRLRVALPSVLGVLAHHLLETAVLRHTKPPADTFAPQPRGGHRWPVRASTTVRADSPSPVVPRLGRTFHSSAIGRRRRRQAFPTAAHASSGRYRVRAPHSSGVARRSTSVTLSVVR